MMNYVSTGLPGERDRLAEWRRRADQTIYLCSWLNGAEELYDNATDPYQLRICGMDVARRT